MDCADRVGEAFFLGRSSPQTSQGCSRLIAAHILTRNWNPPATPVDPRAAVAALRAPHLDAPSCSGTPPSVETLEPTRSHRRQGKFGFHESWPQIAGQKGLGKLTGLLDPASIAALPVEAAASAHAIATMRCSVRRPSSGPFSTILDQRSGLFYVLIHGP